jgi:CDP-paratose 2-epimerase
MKILITGGAGFVGSHVAEYYAKKDDEIRVFDNLSRAELLGYKTSNAMYNWNYLKRYENIELIKGDIRDAEMMNEAAKDVDVIIHTAAQTAVTTSLKDPRTDFEVNALGTFNVLEAARLSKNNPCVIFCSTNKVYGDNVNKIPVREKDKRYEFGDEKYKNGIPEDFSIDLCEHTPYGCSKFLVVYQHQLKFTSSRYNFNLSLYKS